MHDASQIFPFRDTVPSDFYGWRSFTRCNRDDPDTRPRRRRILYNARPGCFAVSDEAKRRYAERTGKALDDSERAARADETLISIVQTLGRAASVPWVSDIRVATVGGCPEALALCTDPDGRERPVLDKAGWFYDTFGHALEQRESWSSAEDDSWIMRALESYYEDLQSASLQV